MKPGNDSGFARLQRFRVGPVGILAVFVLLCALSIQKIWAGDLWWQLRTGAWILEHHTVPSHDVFSYTAGGHEWVEMRWLFCIAAYLLWSAGGPSLVILVQTAVLALTLWLFIAPVRRTAETLLGVVVLTAGVASAASRFVFRPEIVSYLCVAIFLVILQGHARGRFRRAVWILPLIQILWTNAHTVFIFGPVLAWTFAGGALASSFMARLAAQRTSRGAAKSGGGGGAARGGTAAGADRSTSRDPAGATAEAGEGSIRTSLLVGTLVTAACWINPYFHRGAMFPFLLFREIRKGSILSTTIMEFRSPLSIDRWSWDLYVATTLIVITAATFLLNWRRTDPARLAIWGSFLYLACVSVRNVAPFAFVAIWATLNNLEEIGAGSRRTGQRRTHDGQPAGPGATGGKPSQALRGSESGGAGTGTQALAGSELGRAGAFRRLVSFWRGSFHGEPAPRSRPERVARIAFPALLLAASWYVVSDRFYVRMGAPRRFGLGVIEWHTPRGATTFILDNRPLPQLFHSMGDGSYLTWAAAGRYPVYIDGRLEVYGEEFIERYFRLGDTSWESFADAAGVNTLLLERQYFGSLVGLVNASPRWALVYIDARDLVFLRNIPEHSALIRKYRIDPRSPYVPHAPEPEERPFGWRHLIGSVEQPWYSYAMARNFLALGSVANAERFLTRGLERFPEHQRMRKLLADIRARTGRPGAQADPE